MYIKLTNGVPEEYTIIQLRLDNPTMSFPKTISNEILAKFDVYSYTQQEYPMFDEKTQRLENDGFIKQNDNWIKTWKIVEKTQEEIDALLAEKADAIKTQRNRLLAETDHLALVDNTLTPEMAAYRQALRNITSQTGFPENVIWPTKPS